MIRLVGASLLSVAISTPLAAQQDTVVSRVSSDTVTVPVDSVMVDSVPVTRVDTVGWDFTW